MNRPARTGNRVLYRDARGFVWQRMQNGTWRSTCGLTAVPALLSADTRDPATGLPRTWAPYTRVFEASSIQTLTNQTDADTGWDGSTAALLEAAWGLIANVWDCAGREKFAEWIDAASRWRDRYHQLLDQEKPAETP